MKTYHLVHSNDEWKLKQEGAELSTKVFESKESAMDYSIDYMRNNGGSLVVHKMNNQFQEERTYPRSNDPRESKG